LYMGNTLAKYFEIFFNSCICYFLKSPRSFYRRSFLTLLAFWFDSCKTFHTYMAVVALVIILKMAPSRHWWMIISAYWSFIRVFCTTSLWKVNVTPSIGSSKSFSTVSHAS
jgi:hypothetical protein